MTDGNGRYWARCPGGPDGMYYISGQFELHGLDFEFEGYVIGGFTDDNYSCQADGGDTAMGSDDQMLIFYELSDVVAKSQSFFSPYSRGSVLVSLATDGTSISEYSPFYNEITIQTAGNNRAVGGGYGLFTVAHEYGHALQQGALGGIPSHSCPSPHYIDVGSTVTCAYTEGWADYHAAVTEGTTFNTMDSGGAYFWNETTTDQARNDAGGGNSENIEGSVSAMMYNATSTGGLGLPNTFFADISHSCEIYFDFGFGQNGTIHPDGIDLAVLCGQQAFTGDDISKLTARSLSPYYYQSGPSQPANFSATTFRSNWHGRLLGLQ